MIAAGEYQQRLMALNGTVATAGLDVFLVWDKESIFYLTGAPYENLERPFFVLVRPGKDDVLLVPQLELEHMRKVPNIRDVRSYFEFPAPSGEGWQDVLATLCRPSDAIGVEPSLPIDLYVMVSSLCPNLSVHNLISDMRLVKSDAEVTMIRRAARYADMAIQRLLDASRYGVSVAEMVAQTAPLAGKLAQDLGAEWDPLTTSMLTAPWAAPRSAQPHSIPKPSDLLQGGPHVGLNLTRILGYSAECERTFFTKTPPEEERELFGLMLRARDVGFRMVRPGASCAEIDATVNAFLASNGYSAPDVRLHRTGHGFGLSAHEGPWIAVGSGHVLAENMVISIEPGIYLPEIGGFRHSDTVLVTSDGYETLTHVPTSLAELTLAR